MISKLVDFALRRRVTTAMVVLILCVTGFLSLRRLDTDFMPDIELPSVSVLTLYPGAPPEEMESIVTRPVEQAVNRIRGIRKVRSASTEGLSIVYAEFDWGIELDFAAQEVRDTVGRARAAFPDGVRESLVVKFNLTDFPIMMGGITADIPILELKRKVEDEAVPRLSRIDGVASVLVYSREVREILVDLDMSALDSLGLSIEQVVLALRSANRNVPAGRLDEGSREVLVRALGEFTGLDEIRDTVVGLTAAGGPIAVKDVGTVRDGVKDTGLIYRTGGRKGLMFKVQKRSGANTVRTTRAVREEMARIESSFPGNIRFSPRFDQGLIIERVLEETRKDGLFGGLLAIAFILLFLRSARSTLIVALAIPFSVVTTFIALLAAGASINLLTLGGLALGVGMLVDNAVVVVENIHRYAEAGASRFEAARRGTSEVGAAITVGTLTNIIVFLPIVFAAGLTGRLNRALAMSISFSLLASLVVALTLVPLAAAVLMKDGSPRRRTPAGRQSPLFDAVRKAYRKGLERALRRRGPILAATVLLILLSGALLLSLGREFLPTMDPDWLIFLVRLPVGTAATETDRAVRLAEQILSEEPGVESISAQVGSAAEVSPEDLAGAFSTSGPNEGMIVVGLARGRRRDDSGARIVERVRSRFPRTEGWELKAVDIVQEMPRGSRDHDPG
jgi:HAE1 family hydrophobic/amphiphilic exporter-1